MANERWYYDRDGQTVGPLGQQGLTALAKAGVIGPGTILLGEDGKCLAANRVIAFDASSGATLALTDAPFNPKVFAPPPPPPDTTTEAPSTRITPAKMLSASCADSNAQWFPTWNRLEEIAKWPLLKALLGWAIFALCLCWLLTGGAFAPENARNHRASSWIALFTFLCACRWTYGCFRWYQTRLADRTAGASTTPRANDAEVAAVVSSPPPPPDAPADRESVLLWSPNAIANWSVLLTWAFGALLVAKNWKALGETTKGKRAMVWFYGLFPFVLLWFLVPEKTSWAVSCLGVWILLAWFFIELRPQRKFIKATFSDRYQRKPWGKPVAVWLGVLVLLLLVLGSVKSIPSKSPDNQSEQPAGTGLLPDNPYYH